jgi:glyoxylase I family protein
MGVQLTKDSIDLGIVVRDIDKALHFYRDVLGFEHVDDGPMPGGAHMHRLMCGSSMIKLLVFSPVPEASSPPGGLHKATGYRYWTISVGNLAGIVAACEADGVKVKIPPTEIRPGVSIAMVEDPDGNWVEFLQSS